MVIASTGRVAGPECIALDSHASSCLENSPAGGGYPEAKNDSSEISWKHPWRRSIKTLRLWKPLLQIGLTGVGHPKGYQYFRVQPSTRRKSVIFCQEGPTSIAVITTHTLLWLLLKTLQASVTPTNGEIGDKKRGCRTWCLNARRYWRRPMVSDYDFFFFAGEFFFLQGRILLL